MSVMNISPSSHQSTEAQGKRRAFVPIPEDDEDLHPNEVSHYAHRKNIQESKPEAKDEPPVEITPENWVVKHAAYQEDVHLVVAPPSKTSRPDYTAIFEKKLAAAIRRCTILFESVHSDRATSSGNDE